LLLLHGYPNNHVLWYAVAARLAERYHVVLADLRGYGDSSLPEPGPNLVNYSFRVMAEDMIEVMENLGHPRFFLAATTAARAEPSHVPRSPGPGHEALPPGHAAELLRVDHRKQESGYRRVALAVHGAAGAVSRNDDKRRSAECS